MRLDVGHVVLLGQHVDRAAKRCGHVLAHRVDVILARLRLQHVVRAELQIAQEHFFDLAQVVHLRHGGRAGLNSLDLGKALGLAEDGRVADRHNVHRAVEVLGFDVQAVFHGLDVFLGQVRAVDPVQDLEHAGHRVVQARVDGAEHHHALLDERQGRAHRGVGILVGQLLERGLHHTLAGVHQEAEQLEQRGARAVERQGHGQLANVVDQGAALDLDHLGRLHVDRLASRATLELEQRGDVLDVGRVQQRAKGAGGSARQAANHVREADRVGAAPGHERELDNPVQLLAAIVLGLPVAVQAQGLARGLVNADDVRLHAVTEVQVGVDLEDRPQAVLVVAGVLAAFDLVVGDGGLAELDLIGRAQVHLGVHASLDAAVELGLGDVLNVRLALGAVKVGGCKRQVNVIDGDELGRRALPLRRPHELEVLAAAQGQLRGQLLELAAQLWHLLGGLPVHEVGLAASFFQLLGLDLAHDLGLDRAGGWEHLLHEAGAEVDAGLDQHGVHHLVGARELRAARGIVAQAGAAQAFLVELVALGAGVLVALDLVEQVDHDAGQHALIDLVDDVGEVGLLVGHIALVGHPNDGAAVLGVLDLQVLVGQGDRLAALRILAGVFVFAFVQEFVCHGVQPAFIAWSSPTMESILAGSKSYVGKFAPPTKPPSAKPSPRALGLIARHL